MLDEIRGGIGLVGSLSVALPVFGVVAMGVLALLVWKRTRSTHPLMARLWHLLNGRREYKDSIIGQFLEDQTALMEFRFITGVRARTVEQTHAVIDWTRKNNEDIGDVAACGSYFDMEHIALKDKEKLPSKWHFLGNFALILMLLVGVICLVTGVVSDSVGLQMKKSGVFFMLTAEGAEPLWSKSSLSKAQCLKANLPPDNPFSADDARIICEIFKDKSFTPYLKKSLKEQRIAIGMSIFILSWCCWMAICWLKRGSNARDMLLRLDKKKVRTPLSLVEDVATE